MAYKDTKQFRVGQEYFWLKMVFDNMTEELWALVQSARFDILLPDGTEKQVTAVIDSANNMITYKYNSSDFTTVEGDYKVVGVLLFEEGGNIPAFGEYLLEFQFIPKNRNIQI